MADSTTKPKSSSLPNFYSAAGQMSAYNPPGGGDKSKPGGDAAATGEKVKNVTTLLEVVKKIDKMESDPANKELTQKMVELVQQYMDKLQPGGGPAAGATTGTSEGMTPGAGAGPGPGAGAAGAGGGAGAGMMPPPSPA